MLTDLRLAVRSLAKSPVFTAGVIALLALGIATNTVIFSLVDALLLRPLPVRDPARLVRLVMVRNQIGTRSDFRFDEYEAWKQHATRLEDLIATFEQDVSVTADGNTQLVRVHFVTGDFFDALGTQPALGRVLLSTDQQPSGVAPVVLSYSYWKRRFAGDPGIVGKSILLNDHPVQIVGVSAKGFNGLSVETGPDLRAPNGWLASLGISADSTNIVYEVSARLRPGASAESARLEAESILQNAAKGREGSNATLPGRFDLEPAARGISRLRTQYAGVLEMLMGGVALLMLMVCANVAALLMARMAARRDELAVRVALGATRADLLRHLFPEALLLMLGGTAGAVVLSAAAIPYVVDTLPPLRDLGAIRLSMNLEITPDWRVLGFAVAVSIVTVLLFGLIPSLTAVRRDVHPLLKEARVGGGWRGRQVMGAVQVALCTILMVGAGLTLLTLRRLEHLNAGFDASHIITFSLDSARVRYKPEQTAELQRRLLEGARSLPDVESAAVSARGLMRGTGIKTTLEHAGERAPSEDFMNTSLNAVSPEYFETMRISWVAGANFTGREDFAVTPRPVVVNQAFVRRFGAGRSVIGEKFGNTVVNRDPAKPLFEVIGVVGDTKYRSLREPYPAIVYQRAAPNDYFILHLRTRGSPDAVIAPMRQLLAAIDPRLSYSEVTALKSDVDASLWGERVSAFLAALFSAAAGLIVAAGLYALVSLAVTQRRREIGVRMALGAMPRDVVRLMYAKVAWLAVAGIAAGLAAAWGLSPRIAAILYDVRPRDFSVLAAAAALAFAVTSAGALIPSLRAARVNPASVLRGD